MNPHDIQDRGLTSANPSDPEADSALDTTRCPQCEGLGTLISGETCPVCEGSGKATGRTGGG